MDDTAQNKMKDSEENMSDEQRQSRIRVYKAKRLFKLAEDSRRKYDWEWLVRNLYIRGYHFARYNRSTNTVTFSTRTGVRIPVNLVSAHMRGVRNQVTSFQPKWEVLPKVTTESAQENARYSGKVLDYLYDKAQIRRKIKEVVNDSLWSSVGIWQFDVDSKDNVVINRVDPYDFYVDPNIKSPNLNDPDYGAEFVDKVIQTSVDAIKKNPKYDEELRKQVRADNVVASAEYKKFLIQVTRQMYGGTAIENNETVLLHVTSMRERDESGNIKIRNIHWIDSLFDPLYEELTDSDEYSYEILQGDIAPGELYSESWVKHLIPINRVIDALESHIFEYNHIFARGRFVIDKNSGVRIIMNQHGQIIEKNRGSTVQSLTIAPLPPSPREQIAAMRTYLEDISGVHDVSLGRLPGTLRSGTALAELKQADATNQADLVDNLEDFLSRAGRKILNLVAENWSTSKLISVTALGGKPEYFMAVGESSNLAKKKKNKFTFGEMELPLAVIGSDNEVRVQVGSWLAYTKEARQEKLKELFRLGAIDQKTYLEFAEFADIDGIIERTRDEALMQAQRSMPARNVEREFGVQLSDEQIALAENELMVDGHDQPVYPDDNHQVHLSVHAEKESNDIVRAHMDEHIKMMRWVANVQAQPPGAAPGAGGPQAPGGGQTFPMGAPVGPGAPPFNPLQDMVVGGPETPGLQAVNS
jgi:hypothetical protein